MLERRESGRLPGAPHTQLRAEDGRLLYEHCLTRRGFDGPYTILYHAERPHEAQPSAHGPEELAWSERRRAKDASRNVVLVTTSSAVAGLDELPLSAVQLVAVANTATQERVRELLDLTEYSPRVSVFPPWFVAN